MVDFNKKYSGVPLILILILIGIGLVSAAAVVVYEARIRGTVKIENTTSGENYEIKIYEDEACTQELTFADLVDLGTLRPGEIRVVKWIYVKNTGDKYIPRVEIPCICITSEGWDPYGCGGSSTLDIGEVVQFPLDVRVSVDAQPGTYSGDIPIYCIAEQ